MNNDESYITLHPEHGVNPRLLVCYRCGEPTGVALIGKNNYVMECSTCGLESFGGSPKDKICPKCNERRRWTKKRLIEDLEKIPDNLCRECKAKDEELSVAVKEGGVYWRCSDCGSVGAIKKSPFAEKVRDAHGIFAPEPCGIEFTKNDCPVCGVSANRTE